MTCPDSHQRPQDAWSKDTRDMMVGQTGRDAHPLQGPQRLHLAPPQAERASPELGNASLPPSPPQIPPALSSVKSQIQKDLEVPRIVPPSQARCCSIFTGHLITLPSAREIGASPDDSSHARQSGLCVKKVFAFMESKPTKLKVAMAAGGSAALSLAVPGLISQPSPLY